VGRHAAFEPDASEDSSATSAAGRGPASPELRSDVIRFPSARVIGDGGSPVPGIVEYQLLADESGRPRGIARRAAVLGDPLSEQEPAVEVPQGVSLGFEYMDARGRWSREWADARALPRAVRLAVVVLAPSGRPEPQHLSFGTVVRLPAAGGAR
jgi:hypothetical protein